MLFFSRKQSTVSIKNKKVPVKKPLSRMKKLERKVAMILAIFTFGVVVGAWGFWWVSTHYTFRPPLVAKSTSIVPEVRDEDEVDLSSSAKPTNGSILEMAAPVNRPETQAKPSNPLAKKADRGFKRIAQSR